MAEFSLHRTTSAVADGSQYRSKSDNRRGFLARAGLRLEDGVAMACDHAGHVAVVDDTDKGKGMLLDDGFSVDALVTKDPGLVLFLLTADCIPAVLFDPVAGVLGLAHLSWRTTETRLAARVVGSMSLLGACPERLQVFFGPSIQRASYIMPDPIQLGRPEWGPFITQKDELYALDLPGFNRQELIHAGVDSKNIQLSEIDTAASKEYYSHYRAARAGEPDERFATVAVIGRTSGN